MIRLAILSIVIGFSGLVNAQEPRGFKTRVDKLQQEQGFQPYNKKYSLVISIDYKFEVRGFRVARNIP